MRKDYSYGLDSFLFFSHLFDQRRLCSRKSDIKECLKAPAHREPQETFNSLSKVLFIFPSWYLFAIGLEPAFGFKNEIYHLIYAPIPRSVTLRASTGIWRLRTVRIEPKNESCRGRTVPKNEPNRHPPTVRFMKTEPNRTVVTLSLPLTRFCSAQPLETGVRIFRVPQRTFTQVGSSNHCSSLLGTCT